MRAVTTAFARASYPAVASGSSVKYGAVLVDQDGNAMPGSELDSLTLSIIDTPHPTGQGTGDIVNAVQDVDILNTGRGTVDETGNLTIVLEPSDTLLDSGVRRAIRSLVLKWTFGDGRAGRHQVDFRIEALLN